MPGNDGGNKRGRPRNADKYKDEIASLNDAIAANALDIFARGMELVRGVEVLQQLPDGSERVYRRPPCPKMIQYYLDRFMGRPMQGVEVTGEDGGPIQQAVLIYLPDNGRDKDSSDDGDPTATGASRNLAQEPR